MNETGNESFRKRILKFNSSIFTVKYYKIHTCGVTAYSDLSAFKHKPQIFSRVCLRLHETARLQFHINGAYGRSNVIVI